ncbi:protein OXIDATIVE STRESS 3-like [Prosopis cineraria]|uniref:protein OXIDATIVE STRESS 3-like n=1 Tax=Prosopis cineraria TaxID=364024 RepID=UPI0024109C20|nr:protein OXIDATIVE STRESS 3-like [Prosopis cineraria]XP_054799719.1 protein OXIDATIVE STRESS 3-like [Prosopis cineraria]
MEGFRGKNSEMDEQLKNPMVEARENDHDLVHSFSSSSSGFSSGSSMESDSSEEVTSNLVVAAVAHDSLGDMSSLFQQLPIKRGLSRHYEGKSQSFTSLASVRRLEDLVKEENNPVKMKKMECCRRSYGGLWRSNALSGQIGKGEWKSRRDHSVIGQQFHVIIIIIDLLPQPPPFLIKLLCLLEFSCSIGYCREVLCDYWISFLK